MSGSTGPGRFPGYTSNCFLFLEAARPRIVFDDPFAEEQSSVRPVLVILDDGATDPIMVEQRRSLTEAADARGVRVEVVEANASTEVARYASLLLQGTYSAEYLRLGLVNDG
ncbi:hypothetical protein NBCG_05603 [Nocardioidaceae bacterium Broad-1]|nr:hypothetical protein NBCG_05603 [Nocardioidaceae bacterium Broad-1]